MVVKNEELGLERAILSCRNFVDKIHIAVDDSSTDKTKEIALKYADIVKDFKFDDDFSKARNFAHEGVQTDWILFIDGHEFVQKCERLDEFLNSDADGLLCTIEMESGARFHNPRIYKNGVQFEGAVHERQNCRKVVAYPDFVVKHGRVGGQAMQSILERDLQRNDQVPRLMTAMLKKDKKNIRVLFHLALHAQSIGEYKKAIRYQKLYLKYSKNHDERWFVYFNRSLCLLSLKKYFRAFWIANRADFEVPGRWEIAKLKGIILFSRGKFAEAVVCLVDSFRINTCYEAYKPWGRDEAGTWNVIGEAFYNMNEFYKASIAFSEASKKSDDEKFKDIAEKRAKLMLEIEKNAKISVAH